MDSPDEGSLPSPAARSSIAPAQAQAGQGVGGRKDPMAGDWRCSACFANPGLPLRTPFFQSGFAVSNHRIAAAWCGAAVREAWRFNQHLYRGTHIRFRGHLRNLPEGADGCHAEQAGEANDHGQHDGVPAGTEAESGRGAGRTRHLHKARQS